MTASSQKSSEKKPQKTSQKESATEVIIEETSIQVASSQASAVEIPEVEAVDDDSSTVSSIEVATVEVVIESSKNATKQAETLEPFEVSVKIPMVDEVSETAVTSKTKSPSKEKSEKKPNFSKTEDESSDKEKSEKQPATKKSPTKKQSAKKSDKNKHENGKERSPKSKKSPSKKKKIDEAVVNDSSSNIAHRKSQTKKEKSPESRYSQSEVINFGVTTIDLLRNGVIEDDSVFCGSTDGALTDAGWQQMVSALDNKNAWDLVVSSKLQRCREFAELIASEEDIDIKLDRNFDEIDFGAWEGLAPEKIMKEDAVLLNAWWKAPTKCSPPEGEDFHLFQARVLSAFKNMVDDNCGKKILLVADAWTIRVIIMHVLGLQDESLFRLNVDYACYSQVQIHKDDNGQQGCLIHHGY